jgi:uncharacterized repeat protein (TIGR03803 family)
MNNKISFLIAIFIFILNCSSYSQFQTLHSFTGNASDGGSPKSGLIESNGRLYGTAFQGGSANAGCVFKMNLDGSGFNLMKSFLTTSGGKSPNGALLRIGSTLYGSLNSSFTGQLGGLFKIDTSGGSYYERW